MIQMLRTLTAAMALVMLTWPASAQRRWVVTGQEVPELSAIDHMVQRQMVDFDIRGASVAIVKDGRLVYARGYTWDAPDVEPVQPTTLFRTGSIGKAITSIAVHQLIERGLLNYDTPVASTLGLQPLPGEHVDPRLAGVTVDHLLTHTSGLSSVDNIYEMDALVAAAVGAGPPPTKQEIISYVIGQPFMFDSGTAWDYNNYGYIMLDLLVEEVTGVPYAEYVLDNVFRRVGVRRARVAHQLPTERAPTETDYDGLEGDPYGVSMENAVAAGGWVMAAPDMARLFSALFDFENAGGLLEQDTIDSMLALPFQASADLGYGRGWIQEKFFVDSGHTLGWFTDPGDGLQIYGHGGGGTGIHTLAVWRTDGIVFVWFTNKDPSVEDFDDLPEFSSWPEHDLWESVGVSVDPVGSAPTEAWIPVVAHSDGVGDSLWRSDVGLLNRSPLPNRVRLRLYQRGRFLDRDIELAPGEQKVIGDVMAHFDSAGSAPLRIFSSEPLTVGSRTYNVSPAGTFGQFIDGASPNVGLSTGESAVLMGLAENDSSRTNIGIQNGWKRAADVSISLYDSNGGLVTTINRQIPAEQTVQLNRPFRELGNGSDIDSGYAVLNVKFGRHLLAYASVADNATDDPTTIPMQPGDGSLHQWLAAASHDSGVNGSQWRTDLSLLNRSGVTADVVVRFHSDDGTSVDTAVVLDEDEQLLLSDVVALLGAHGSGSLEVAATGPVLVSSRTFNTSATGTFGQFVGAFSPTDWANLGDTVWLPQLRHDDRFRTNIGVLNTGPGDAGLTIRLFDDLGVELASRQRRLAPGERIQLQEPFARIAGRSDLTEAYASVTVRFGSGVVAYASVVDNATNDPTTVWMDR